MADGSTALGQADTAVQALGRLARSWRPAHREREKGELNAMCELTVRDLLE